MTEEGKDVPKINVNKYRPWTETDKKWLRNNYKSISYRDIAEKLGRTERAIKTRVIVEGWATPKPKWTKNEVSILKKCYSKIGAAKLAERLCRSKNSIFLKMRRLHLGR